MARKLLRLLVESLRHGCRTELSCGNCQEGATIYDPHLGRWGCDTCHAAMPTPRLAADVVVARSERTGQDPTYPQQPREEYR